MQRYSILVFLMLIILTLFVYWPVQNCEFISYDDSDYVTANYRIQSGITFQSIGTTFTDIHTSNWHPLTMISHMLDWELFGDRAGGHHWTNVMIHIFNTILLFLLFRNLTGAIWRSAFVAALFAVHPINVESVAWVAERKNVLSTFFWILTMLFYVWYVKQPNWKRYLPMFISFALGLMSKPMLVTLPFVLLLLDYWPLNRISMIKADTKPTETSLPHIKQKKISSLVLEKIPLFILTAVSICTTIYAAQSARTMAVFFIQRINNAVFSYSMYLRKLFWPTDLYIPYLYLHIPIWQIFLSAILLIMITILVCKYYKKYPYLPVGWFWYLGTLVPVIGIVQVGNQTMADRYAYITFVGLFIMIAWGAEQISSKGVLLKKLLISASVLMILLFTIAACKQVRIWTDTTTLFENAIKKNPNNYLAYQVIGQEMANNGENEKALYYYDMALKANPDFSPAYNNKGLILKTIGRRGEAFENFQKSAQVNKFSVEAYHNMGVFYYENNNLDESIKYFSKAIGINPDYIESYNYLGVALAEKGSIEEGLKYFEKALRINPNNTNAQKNLRIALELKKKNRSQE
jgi:tetratricopeptide (TPR) repeat protein